MSEKIGGAKGTELDDEFIEMERVSPHFVFLGTDFSTFCDAENAGGILYLPWN